MFFKLFSRKSDFMFFLRCDRHVFSQYRALVPVSRKSLSTPCLAPVSLSSPMGAGISRLFELLSVNISVIHPRAVVSHAYSGMLLKSLRVENTIFSFAVVGPDFFKVGPTRRKNQGVIRTGHFIYKLNISYTSQVGAGERRNIVFPLSPRPVSFRFAQPRSLFTG